MVLRTLKLKQLPSVPTLSRLMAQFDGTSVDKLRACVRDLVIDRLVREGFASITIDFDGRELSTKRHAEGTAVGFNKQKKGARSYYLLLCTIAQTGQVFDLLHRSGNVHDSNGGTAFIIECITHLGQRLPKLRI